MSTPTSRPPARPIFNVSCPACRRILAVSLAVFDPVDWRTRDDEDFEVRIDRKMPSIGGMMLEAVRTGGGVDVAPHPLRGSRLPVVEVGCECGAVVPVACGVFHAHPDMGRTRDDLVGQRRLHAVVDEAPVGPLTIDARDEAHGHFGDVDAEGSPVSACECHPDPTAITIEAGDSIRDALAAARERVKHLVEAERAPGDRTHLDMVLRDAADEVPARPVGCTCECHTNTADGSRAEWCPGPCCTPAGPPYRCEGHQCPGLDYPPSRERPHPASCAGLEEVHMGTLRITREEAAALADPPKVARTLAVLRTGFRTDDRAGDLLERHKGNMHLLLEGGEPPPGCDVVDDPVKPDGDDAFAGRRREVTTRWFDRMVTGRVATTVVRRDTPPADDRRPMLAPWPATNPCMTINGHLCDMAPGPHEGQCWSQAAFDAMTPDQREAYTKPIRPDLVHHITIGPADDDPADPT